MYQFTKSVIYAIRSVNKFIGQFKLYTYNIGLSNLKKDFES